MQVPRWHRNPWCCPALHSFTNTFEATSTSYWFDKPWFPTEGKLAAALIIPSSWGSQRTCVFHVIKQVFWRRCRGSRVASARGISHFQSLYFVFVLLTLFLFCLVCFLYIKNTKKLVTCFTFVISA